MASSSLVSDRDVDELRKILLFQQSSNMSRFAQGQ